MNSKDARYNKKRRAKGKHDYHYVTREDGKRVTNVSRRALSVSISLGAFEKLVALSQDEGIDRWKMLTRMIIYSIPKYSHHTSGARGDLHQWDQKLINPEQRSVKYKGKTGDKQINYDVSSTAWNKLECHKTALGMSKARIVQSIILNYKPTTKEQRAYMKKRDDETREKHGYWSEVLQPHKEKSDTSKPSKASKKFRLEKYAGELSWVHVKGISPEYWDEEELDEYQRLTGWEI